jgi:hypothetical protein
MENPAIDPLSTGSADDIPSEPMEPEKSSISKQSVEQSVEQSVGQSMEDTPPTYESVVEQGPGAAPAPPPASSPAFSTVRVVDPVKQGDGVNAYTSYKVVTVDAQGARREVIRRFRDFVWVRNCLGKEFAGIILPSLPPRNVVEKYKMTPDFVEDRRRALEVFLVKTTSHPTLSGSPELDLFLRASESEFMIESCRMSNLLGSAAPAESGGASGLASNALSTASKFFPQSLRQCRPGITRTPCAFGKLHGAATCQV